MPEAAIALNLSQKSLRGLIDKGEIPHVFLGKSVRIPKSSLNNYLSQQLHAEQKDDENDSDS